MHFQSKVFFKGYCNNAGGLTIKLGLKMRVLKRSNLQGLEGIRISTRSTEFITDLII